MDFEERLRGLATRAQKTDHLQTEAATSTALVLPLIQALGYDVFDPSEVVPEFTADVGTKKGEKVDFAIMREGAPAILFEVKAWNVKLGPEHTSQLYRYFSVTPVRVGVLTNGLEYWFFSDLDAKNKMDARPFFRCDIRDLRDADIEVLRGYTRARFQASDAVDAAAALKYVNGIKAELANEWESPSEDLVRLLAKRVYSGTMTAAARERFEGIVRTALHQFVSDRIKARLQTALDSEDGAAASDATPSAVAPAADTSPAAAETPKDGVETTEEEMEAFRIVRAIMAEVVDPARITMRDRQSYCGVLLDDNSRRPVCRLWFNRGQKYVGVFDAEKNEERVPIESPVDVYRLADRLRATASFYS